MPAQSKPHITVAEYLEIERHSELKSEYYAGEMFAMGGGSRSHNLIVAHIIGELHAQLRERPCVAYPSDMRVRIPVTNLYTYPDVVVVCGEEAFDDEHRDTLLNPSVLFEVLSSSTEAYDRGTKFDHYRRIFSLQEYLLVAQNEPRIEQYTRQPDDRWLLTVYRGTEAVVEMPSIRCTLALSEVYHKVILEPKPPLHNTVAGAS